MPIYNPPGLKLRPEKTIGVRTYARTYFLSLCGLAVMGRRSGRVFFLVVVLVPWVAGWAVLSFSLRSWCHGSSPGQWFLSLCGLGAMGRGLGNVFFVVGHRSQAGQFGLSFGLSPTCRLLVLLRTYVRILAFLSCHRC